MAVSNDMERTMQYGIPVALQNLTPAETLNQMVDNLNYLCVVMDNAFDAGFSVGAHGNNVTTATHGDDGFL